MILRSRFKAAKPLQALRRTYKVLAIESSCDDSCVALLDRFLSSEPPRIIDEARMTLNSALTGGVIPTAAHEFHQKTIAQLINGFLAKNGLGRSTPPDLICCTRGPGMVGSLSASLQLAKGLAVAWERPLVGVHHMLGHVLTANLPKKAQPDLGPPKYPFLSLLCSGGHTMLVLLSSLTEHEIVIDTCDIAAGDSLDKCARELGFLGNMLGKELERYVASIPEQVRADFASIRTHTRDNEFGLKLVLPLRSPKHEKVPAKMEFAFASFLSTIQEYKQKHFSEQPMDERTRMFLAYKVQELLFDHIVNRINVSALKDGTDRTALEAAGGKFSEVRDFICSGGVASNSVLREKLLKDLLSFNNSLKFHFPDLRLCTDNAVMIGVAGIEIFESLRVKSDLSILPIRRWPMSEVLLVGGYERVSEEEFKRICR